MKRYLSVSVITLALSAVCSLAYSYEVNCETDTECVLLCMKQHPTWSAADCEDWVMGSRPQEPAYPRKPRRQPDDRDRDDVRPIEDDGYWED